MNTYPSQPGVMPEPAPSQVGSGSRTVIAIVMGSLSLFVLIVIFYVILSGVHGGFTSYHHVMVMDVAHSEYEAKNMLKEVRQEISEKRFGSAEALVKEVIYKYSECVLGLRLVELNDHEVILLNKKHIQILEENIKILKRLEQDLGGRKKAGVDEGLSKLAKQKDKLDEWAADFDRMAKVQHFKTISQIEGVMKAFEKNVK